MQSDDSPQTVHFVPLPQKRALLKIPAWQLALGIIDPLRILLLVLVLHLLAIVVNLLVFVYRLQNPCPRLA